VEWAWQVHDGVFFLPSIHRTLAERNNRYLRVPIHTGIWRTFLQHPQTRPKSAEPKNEEEVTVIQIDENTTIKIPQFSVIFDSGKSSSNSPKQHATIGKILAGKAALSSAYYPGIAPRFPPDKGLDQLTKAGPATLICSPCMLVLRASSKPDYAQAGKAAIVT
jgi:hypothetical protein